MFDFFFNLDVRTLIQLLFFGNLASVALICAYYFASDLGRQWESCRLLLVAKSLQACAYVLLLSREFISPLLSVNLGNTLLLTGFYFEAVAMSRIIQETRSSKRYLQIVLGVCLIAFNLVEFVYPNSSVRVGVASLCTFAIFLMPCVQLFFSSNMTRFKQLVGVMYLFFVILQFPRMVYAFTTSMSILTNSFIQTLTFLALALLLIFGLPAYLLLIKERTDKALATMTTTDFLTGLLNRYNFLDAANRVFLRCRMSDRGIAIVYMNIDRFKSINDGYGHAFGDAVLVSAGGVIRENLRPIDLSCRYSGDEFILLLYDTDASGAVIVANRIRRALGTLHFDEYSDFKYTVSVGFVAGVPDDADSLDLYIGRADTAMYMAKRAGRDRIVEYDPVSAFAVDI